MHSFACPAGGKSAAANCSLRKGCIPCTRALPGCWAEGEAVHLCSQGGSLRCGVQYLPSSCFVLPCCLKGRRVGAVREPSALPQERGSHRAPQPHLAGFYLRSDTHSPGAAGTARRTRHYSSDLLGTLKNCMNNIFWKGSKYEQMKKSRVYLTSKIERKDRMCLTRYPCKTVSSTIAEAPAESWQTESPGTSPVCFSPLFAVFAALLMAVSRCWVKICQVEWMKLGSIHRHHPGFCTHTCPDLDTNMQVLPRPAYSLCWQPLPPDPHLP